ncbi:MAG: putative DCC family thiol-disulfide oxidoreductase YuxK [Halioglobus sp.]|jgi:predicted DCC family thiol-disulfide oxidoreductase YuxK
MDEKDILFYDGQCPLCVAEVNTLRCRSNDTLSLSDIHNLPPGTDGPDKKVLLSRLHLRTASGEWLTGARANLRAWEHTDNPGWTRIMGWPGIRVFTFLGYEVWLIWYRWQKNRREAADRG